MAGAMGVRGFDGLDRALGVLADSLSPRETAEAMEAFIRETRSAGLTVPLVEREFTLEGHAEDLFDSEGKSAYNRKPWVGYENEPKYAAYKEARGAGSKIGTWLGSQSPLSRTLTDRRDPDHVEAINIIAGVVEMLWGSVRTYIRAFSEGGRHQRWDNIDNPGRKVDLDNTRAAAFRLGKGLHRRLVAKLQAEGRKAGEALRGMRLNPRI